MTRTRRDKRKPAAASGYRFIHYRIIIKVLVLLVGIATVLAMMVLLLWRRPQLPRNNVLLTIKQQDPEEPLLSKDVPKDCPTKDGKLIIVNVLGLLANDLFEVAFANRMAHQLNHHHHSNNNTTCHDDQWTIVYRSMWSPAWPTQRTDQCFPNVARPVLPPGEVVNRQVMDTIRDIGGNMTENNETLARLYDALTYNQLEPSSGDMDFHKAMELHKEWIASLGDTALTVEHLVDNLQNNAVDLLAAQLGQPTSPVRVLNLQAFFIHYDWMNEWLTPHHIYHWLHMDESCCPTPAPPSDTIVIHIRDFAPEEEDKNKHLQVGVYRDIIDHYYRNEGGTRPHVWVVCPPKSVTAGIVQDIVREFGAAVHPGTDAMDAMCLLSRARHLIATTSSSYSQMAALLAQGRHSNQDLQVHYPTHTLSYPACTMKVPHWKYHLTNPAKDGIAEFDVDQSRLQVEQA